MGTLDDNRRGDAERSMSDLHTVRPSSLASPNELSIGDLRTAQTKSRPSTTAESEGDLIAGKYKISRRLGQGGMGVVYLAVDQKLDREVCDLPPIPVPLSMRVLPLAASLAGT